MNESLHIKIIIACMVLMLSIAIAQPYFEARSFNKFSKVKATYFDALISDLRITPTE